MTLFAINSALEQFDGDKNGSGEALYPQRSSGTVDAMGLSNR
jgi:hypothetical protein